MCVSVCEGSQRSLLWALCDDDCWRKTPRARLAGGFNFIGQSVTVIQINQCLPTTTLNASINRINHIYPSSSVSVGTLLYHCMKDSSVLKTQFLQEDCRSRI